MNSGSARPNRGAEFPTQAHFKGVRSRRRGKQFFSSAHLYHACPWSNSANLLCPHRFRTKSWTISSGISAQRPSKKTVESTREAKSKSNEREFFRHIETIYEAVANAGIRVLRRQPIAKICYLPEKAPISSDRENSSRPDCSIALASSKSCEHSDKNEVHNSDIFLTCEFNKKDTNSTVYDVSAQSLSKAVFADYCLRTRAKLSGACGILCAMTLVSVLSSG